MKSVLKLARYLKPYWRRMIVVYVALLVVRVGSKG